MYEIICWLLELWCPWLFLDRRPYCESPAYRIFTYRALSSVLYIFEWVIVRRNAIDRANAFESGWESTDCWHNCLDVKVLRLEFQCLELHNGVTSASMGSTSNTRQNILAIAFCCRAMRASNKNKLIVSWVHMTALMIPIVFYELHKHTYGTYFLSCNVLVLWSASEHTHTQICIEICE